MKVYLYIRKVLTTSGPYSRVHAMLNPALRIRQISLLGFNTNTELKPQVKHTDTSNIPITW